MVVLTHRLTRPAERLLEDAAALDSCHVEPSPAPGAIVFSTGLLTLIRQQFRRAFAHAVIVRLGDAHGGFVCESNQALVGNRESELAVECVLA